MHLYRNVGLPAAFCIVCMGVFTGCAGRKTPTARPTSQPSEPSPSEPPVEENSRSGIASSRFPKKGKIVSPPATPGYTEEGSASWYGEPFHGRRASNGEIYDMYKLTAAHRTLPFETILRVTNLNNGKSTTVRITDRGPFVGNRIIDLSKAAAQEIESIGSGVVPVRIEVLSPGVELAAGFFTVQVGAFRDKANAERLRSRLMADYPQVFIQQYELPEGIYYRVLVGKISGEEEARQFGQQLRLHGQFTPLIIRLDENAVPGDVNER
jgi:rare lipoprotein A